MGRSPRERPPLRETTALIDGFDPLLARPGGAFFAMEDVGDLRSGFTARLPDIPLEGRVVIVDFRIGLPEDTGEFVARGRVHRNPSLSPNGGSPV